MTAEAPPLSPSPWLRAQLGPEHFRWWRTSLAPKALVFFSFQCNIHQGAGFFAFPPFPPPTRFASAEELQEQKVKIDLPPLFLFYFFLAPTPCSFAKPLRFPLPAPTLPARRGPRATHGLNPNKRRGRQKSQPASLGGAIRPHPNPIQHFASSFPPPLEASPAPLHPCSPAQCSSCRCTGDL